MSKQDNEKDAEKEPHYWAKPVRSRSSSAVRGPDKDGKEHQVCQVGLVMFQNLHGNMFHIVCNVFITLQFI